jgi:hypothetical protein
MGGQSSEEAAELVATIRGEHVVMKNWFMSPTKEAGALREKFGPYPGLWKEVLTWPGWKEARKSYLRFIQAKETPSSSSSDINIKQEAADNDDGAPRKRRSRWGVASEAPNDNNNDTSNGSPPQKRRSRWGRDAAPPPAPNMAPPPPMLRTNKIRIPIEEHPQYNFIGLIIGPRGYTQKELENKTGCKIAIRGRSSVKEGARGRRDRKVMESDDEPLHVVVSGDDQRSVDAATDMIEQMLVPL